MLFTELHWKVKNATIWANIWCKNKEAGVVCLKRASEVQNDLTVNRLFVYLNERTVCELLDKHTLQNTYQTSQYYDLYI